MHKSGQEPWEVNAEVWCCCGAVVAAQVAQCTSHSRLDCRVPAIYTGSGLVGRGAEGQRGSTTVGTYSTILVCRSQVGT